MARSRMAANAAPASAPPRQRARPPSGSACPQVRRTAQRLRSSAHRAPLRSIHSRSGSHATSSRGNRRVGVATTLPSQRGSTAVGWPVRRECADASHRRGSPPSMRSRRAQRGRRRYPPTRKPPPNASHSPEARLARRAQSPARCPTRQPARETRRAVYSHHQGRILERTVPAGVPLRPLTESGLP